MINQNRLLTLFEQLISFDSPSFGEREICDFLIHKLKDLGLRPDEDESYTQTGGNAGNIYANAAGTLALPSILFSAHMDTVEPSKSKKMLVHTDGSITSDGTTVLGADDCAGLAAIIEALTALKETGLPHRPIELLFTAAEEPYCVGVRHFDVSRLESKEAYIFDLTGPVGHAANQAPTILAFHAEFTGLAAHAGFSPEDGKNALKAACMAVAKIPCGKNGDMTVNIGTITGGTADNIVPASCTITGEIRSLSDRQADAQLNAIFAIINQSAENCGVTVKTNYIKNCVAYHTETEHAVVSRFQSACAQAGLTPALSPTYGGSDNNHLAQYGIKGLVLATAMNNCHSCSEYTSKPELTNAATLAYLLMKSTE